MINVRKRNAKLFTNLFKNDDRFLIQKKLAQVHGLLLP